MQLHQLLRATSPEDVGRVATAEPIDERDAIGALLEIYDIWLNPVETLGDRVRLQNHPALASLKWRLEERFLAQLEDWTRPPRPTSADVSDALRRLARQTDDSIYEWVATSADWSQLVTFLAIEGGPDGGFDDLVALCQVGIRGDAKVTLAANYWDEMGRGKAGDVHTVLHDRLVAAVDLPTIPRSALPVSALYRTALGGLLATNRWLQPEMLGALGLLELQAGPRCRKVLKALERLGAPADAFPFYEEHANTDPRHGKEWLDGALVPLVDAHPEWAPGMIRGARWRAEVNTRLFTDAHALLQRADDPLATSQPA